MSNYDDFKKKAKDALDTIADVSVEAYRIAEEKARVLAKKAKLSAGITNERALIRRLKIEIGGAYYKLHKDAPEEALKQSCDEITSSLERIAAKQRELDELKNDACECDLEVDVDVDIPDDAEDADAAGEPEGNDDDTGKEDPEV